MKKVCIVTAARSEYGLLRWVIKDMVDAEGLQPQVLVTGSHLSPEHGYTIQAIVEDGVHIDKTIEMLLSSTSSVGIAKSMGLCAISIADALQELKPDLLLVLGDRYELLPICSTALVMSIPIAHISGGDVTEGAIDNRVRNAVTMMSNLHFPGTEESAERIACMTGNAENIYPVGEPGLDNFNRCELLSRKELAENLHLDMDKRWILLTLHPETMEGLDYNLAMAHYLKESLDQINDIQVVITYANADLYGSEINQYFKKVAQENPKKYSQLTSLGQTRYLSFMKEVWAVVGNSSSGIVEAPFIAKPVVNVGNRQKGRHVCTNVIDVDNSKEEIEQAFKSIPNLNNIPDKFWGDGYTSQRVIAHIQKYFS